MGGMPMMGGVGRSDLLGRGCRRYRLPLLPDQRAHPRCTATFTAKPGQRIRIRFINAGTDTAFRVALAGHPMTVTHTDGYPVQPVKVDAVLIGMGERYDVVVTAADGVFPWSRRRGQKSAGTGPAVHRRGTAPDPHSSRPNSNGEWAWRTCSPPHRTPPWVNTTDTNLLGAVASRRHDGLRLDDQWAPIRQHRTLTIRQGQAATLTFTNMSMTWHPMHCTATPFKSSGPTTASGARKDTAIVLPMQNWASLLSPTIPGVWMLHCHNTYHQEAGMMTSLNYTT